MMRLRLRIIAVVISSICLASARGAPATQHIDDAITELGDLDPKVRDLAAKTLREAGAGSRAVLQAATLDNNPEIASRARGILKSTPAIPPPIAADDDAQEPSIIRYRASAPAAKRQTITFIAATLGGVRALAQIWLLETDPEIRAAIFEELMHRPTAAVTALLASGNIASAELLLQAAVDKKTPGSQASYAAYALCRGTLDDCIRQWSSRGGHQPPDAWAEQVLSALYRAKGDATAAMSYAEASDDRELIRQTRLWAGDWPQIAAEIRQQNAGGQNFAELSFLVGIDALTRDSRSLDIDVLSLKKLAQTQQAVRAVSNVLMLAGRPDDSVETCVSSHEYGAAYEQMMIRGRFDDAAALLAAHDTDASPAAALLRCAAAKSLARFGKIPDATALFQRIIRDKGSTHIAEIDLALAEAEREAGMTDQAWQHFADALDPPEQRSPAFSYLAFPSRADNVDWTGLWFLAQTQNPNRPRTSREIFDRIRSAYDRSMPIEELTSAINGVDLSADLYRPYIGLAWEAAQRMIEKGNEAEGIKFAEQCANQAQGGELYIDLGDHAAFNGDWPIAAQRYLAAWRKDPSQALPLYLHGLALVHCGQTTEGSERIAVARLLPLGDGNLREDLMRGLALRGFDSAAGAEANVLILTDHPLSRSVDMAMRIAAERDAERGQCDAAAALFERSIMDFMGGPFAFPEPSMNLFLASAAGRARARDLLARGDWQRAQQQIKACYNLLPNDIEVAIDIVPDLEKLGKKKEADAMFAECFATQQELCARFPDSANQHNQLAWLAAKCNRELDTALQHAKRAVELMPKRTSYIDTLAEVYFMRGQYDEAIVEMKKCVAIEPTVWRHRRQIERFEAKKAAPNNPAKPTPSSLE